MSSSTLEEKLKDMIERYGNDVSFLDALYQWAQNPFRYSDYARNYPYIAKNLELRYGKEIAERTVEILKQEMAEILKAETSVYKIMDLIRSLITTKEPLLIQEVFKRISGLPLSDRLIIHIAIQINTGYEIYFEASIDRSRFYDHEYSYGFRRLMACLQTLLDVYDPYMVVDLLIKAGVINEFLSIGYTKKSTYDELVYIKPPYIQKHPLSMCVWIL